MMNTSAAFDAVFTNYTQQNTSPSTPLHSTVPYNAVDTALGVLVLLCTVVGLVGNSAAFLYFWQKKKKCLAPLLYTVISAVDFLTCAVTFPMISSLFNNRDPTFLQGSSPICWITLLINTFTTKMSMFLVMLLSFTRTLAISLPYYPIKNNLVMLTILTYGVVLLIIDIIYLGKGWMRPVYRQLFAFCIFQVPHSSLDTPRSTYNLYAVSVQIELLVPSLIVFGSFLMSIRALTRKQKSHYIHGEKDTQNRRVSVTIAMFTGVFLLCNLLYFFTQLILLFEVYTLNFHLPIYNNKLFRWYSGLLSSILTTLNAALNPCLYVLRMPHYRSWLRNLVKNPASLKVILAQPARRTSEYLERFTTLKSSKYSRRLRMVEE